MDNFSNSNSDSYNERELYLEKLLQKSRQGEHAEIVNNVADSQLPLEEKIRRIEELDSRYMRNALEQENISSREIDRIIKRKNILTFDEASKVQNRIIRRISRNTLLLYWFRDLKKIRKFGDTTGLIRPSFFPPAIYINKSVMDRLLAIQKNAFDMLKIISPILPVAWAYMSKNDYNLLVQFRNLCEALSALPVSGINFSERRLLERFRDIEKYFLICHYHPEYPETIAGSIGLVYAKYPQYTTKAAGFTELAKRILWPDDKGESLYRILEALNIAAYRRFLELKDLKNLGLEKVVSDYGFDCDDKTQGKINLYIEGLMQKLQYITNVKGEAGVVKSFLNRFLNREEEGGYDLKILRNFYKLVGDESQANFAVDSKNVSVFARNFFHHFMKQFWRLLVDRLPIEDFGEIKIFDQTMFGREFTQLRKLSDELEKVYFNIPSLPMERFIALIHDPNNKPSPVEAQLIKLIDLLCSVILTIGRKLAQVFLNYDSSQSSSGDPALINPDMIESHHFSIPYWNKKVLLPGFIEKLPFSEALSYTVSLCFLACIYLHDSEIGSLLEKDSRLSDKIGDMGIKLEWVCDPVTYEKISRQYFSTNTTIF